MDRAGLSLSELTLSHFRSHRTLRLSLDGRPVVIFGPNGAGKTNILEAVSLLSPGRGLRRAAAEDISRKPEGLGWKISAVLNSLGRVHEVDTTYQPDTARQVRIDGKAATQLALGRIARILWLVPAMDRLWIEGADGRRRFLDRMTLSFEPGHGDATLAYEKAMRERNRMLKDGITDPSWYRAVEAQMAQSGAQIVANRERAVARVAAAQDGAETAFPAAELALMGPDDLPDIREEDELA
ncbi:MAG: AAA family ATPase, partial [Paracoccaceae bacterium]|nr:AAA family ATPase [Paracoccaceae bacterium]